MRLGSRSGGDCVEWHVRCQAEGAKPIRRDRANREEDLLGLG